MAGIRVSPTASRIVFCTLLIFDIPSYLQDYFAKNGETLKEQVDKNGKPTKKLYVRPAALASSFASMYTDSVSLILQDPRKSRRKRNYARFILIILCL